MIQETFEKKNDIIPAICLNTKLFCIKFPISQPTLKNPNITEYDKLIIIRKNRDLIDYLRKN